MLKFKKVFAVLFTIALLSTPAFLLGCEVEEEEPLDEPDEAKIESVVEVS